VRAWERTEAIVADQTSGRRQPGSGSGLAKGDVVSPTVNNWWTGVLYECKHTDAKSFSLTAQAFSKVQREAVSSGRLPVMVVDVGGQRLAVLEFSSLTDILRQLMRSTDEGGECGFKV